MVELMVVIAIIAVLMGLLLPSLMEVRVQIKRSASLATVRLIDSACEAYFNDFEAYPLSHRPSGADYLPDWDGKYLLPLLLTGYAGDPGTRGEPFGSGRRMHEDDGEEGFGYRVVARGTVYGPYNGTDDVEMRPPGEEDEPLAFVDAFGNQVFYYRFRGNGGEPTYHEGDNEPDPNCPFDTADFPNCDRPELPDYAQRLDDDNCGGPYFRRTFILCTMGPNQRFEAFCKNPATDDVTNFLQE